MVIQIFYCAFFCPKRVSEEAQGDAGVVDAVVVDVCGDEIGFGFELRAGVAHGDFGPVVDTRKTDLSFWAFPPVLLPSAFTMSW